MDIPLTIRQAYTELDSFLELLDNNYRNKIPQNLRDFFKKEKDINYIKNINPKQPIKEQNLKKETLALIAMLNLQYWCEDESEKKRLIKIYAQNEEKYQAELRQKYNPDDLFKNKKKVVQNQAEEQNAIIEYKKDTLFVKIKNFIKKLLKKN